MTAFEKIQQKVIFPWNDNLKNCIIYVNTKDYKELRKLGQLILFKRVVKVKFQRGILISSPIDQQIRKRFIKHYRYSKLPYS